MGAHVQLKQATCTEERADAARRFAVATGLQVPSLLLDGEEDGFMHLLCAHPQRFFVIDGDGVLRFKATPFGGEYDLSDVDRALERLCE